MEGSEAPTAKKDIFQLIKEAHSSKPKSSENDSIETHLVFLGAPRSGKTSVILRFLDRDETPSPTLALDYTFARRTRGINNIKDVAHIWELGGATSSTPLLRVPINEQNLHLLSVFIVVDLSKPHQTQNTLNTVLPLLLDHIRATMSGLTARGSKRPKALTQHSLKKWESHPDKDKITISPIPLTIIATNYDKFLNAEPSLRKTLSTLLRYSAHTHSASLLFTSLQHPPTLQKLRTHLSQHAFRTNGLKHSVFDMNKPLCIVAGQDLLSNIGPVPSGAELLRVFGEEPTEEKPFKFEWEKYTEYEVDRARAQKDEELERLRELNARKAKEKKREKTGEKVKKKKDREKDRSLTVAAQ
ncbi:Cytoplasmic dynein 2 light intermediate chain 1 [Gaertneriomyces sp. JEL0708]|nr:Cytoplasmic dynein 2 light intermediate chain 1 [Gaertneriomyces sp. JEL0708]